MRRFSAILAVLALSLVLTACGKDDDRNNGGSPSRPDTNQSQNAPQDNGSGGSWQNGTDTPTQPGAGGEIQLTDALVELLKTENVYAYVIDPAEGFDTGTVATWLEANVALAMRDPKLAAHLRETVGGLFA